MSYKEITIPSKEELLAKEATKPGMVIEVPLEALQDKSEEDQGVAVEPVKVEDEKVSQDSEKSRSKEPGRAQKRIKQLVNDKHDLAARLAAAEAEKEALRRQLMEGSKSTKVDLKSTLEKQIATLNKSMADAIRNGEADQVVSLQDELVNLKMRLAGLTAELQETESVQKAPEVPKQEVPKVPARALEWIEDHPEFTSDEIFHTSAIVINNQLLREGYDAESEEFYEALDARLSKRFPEMFDKKEKNSVELSKESESPSDSHQDDKPKVQKARTTEQVVSGSTRPSANTLTSKKAQSVTLSPQEIAQADKWGMSYEQMALRKAHIESNRGVNGYVPIQIKKQ